MRKYEIMMIFDTEADSLENVKNFAKETYSSNNITIEEEKDMGQKDLSFPINEKNRGHYFLFNVTSETKNLEEAEKAFKLSKNILRYLVIKKG